MGPIGGKSRRKRLLFLRFGTGPLRNDHEIYGLPSDEGGLERPPKQGISAGLTHH